MKKFQFRLESALRVRQVQLKAEQGELSRLLAEEQRLQNSLHSIGNERREAIAYIQTTDSVTNTDLRALSGFLLGADNRVAGIRDAIQKNKARIQQQRQRVLAADRKLRLLVKLREKKHGEWVRETDRQLEASAQESWLAGQYSGG